MAERDPERLYKLFMGDRYETVEEYVRNRTPQLPEPEKDPNRPRWLKIFFGEMDDLEPAEER